MAGREVPSRCSIPVTDNNPNEQWQLALSRAKELFMFRRTPRMNALGVFSLPLNTIVLCLGLMLSADFVSAQTAKDLVGAWTTVSVTVEQGDKKFEPIGPNPKGNQIYGTSGRICLDSDARRGNPE